MFGSGKIQNLEAQLRTLNEKLEQMRKEKTALEQKLSGAQRKISELEDQLVNTDVEQLKEEVLATKAEYEGLKDLYSRKIQTFDSSREEQEQAFAREAAIERHNLENEIRDNRKANQDYVSNTVKTFSDSYNYYLSQIKLLMDALGDVASRTGEALFADPGEDLKAKFGQQMADKLKSETDALRGDNGGLILIGTNEEVQIAPKHEEEAAEEPAEEAEAEKEPDFSGLDSLLFQSEAQPEAEDVPAEEAAEEAEEDPLKED